jgi:hypothetical protein
VAQPVYSVNFLSESASTGLKSFPVPAGFRAVIRDLDIVLEPTGGAVLQLFGAGVGIWIAEVGFEGSFTYYAWRGRQVVDYPSAIDVNTSDTADYRLSGYLLSLP